MKQAIFIEGPLPGLNELIGAAKSRGYSRSGWNGYSNIKRTLTTKIYWEILQQGVKPMKRAYIHFLWKETNRSRDPDNFTSAGKKIILDALVKAGILKNDGWSDIDGWDDQWCVVNKNPGVLVTLEERA